MIDERLLKNEEKALYSLRALYKQYGYLPFKMSKFEPYELYMHHKEFLVSDRIITFNDIGGKLLALKPDVTLSIIKNGKDVEGCKQKVYYNENVYRVSGSTKQFKEILQTGLECIGDIDLYDIFEAVSLAAQSLTMISDDFVLEISHLGILSALLDESSTDEVFRKEAAHCIAEKNAHDLEKLCRQYDVSETAASKLRDFIGIYGDMDTVLGRLEGLCEGTSARTALSQLRKLRSFLRGAPYENKITFDFSIVNDMDYYNGFVFKGFLDGICEGVLAGGQYDKLMRQMGRRAGAVGFALYLDLLEALQRSDSEYDVDVLLLYDNTVDTADVIDAVQRLTANGKSVSAQKSVPKKLRFKELSDLRKGNRA